MVKGISMKKYKMFLNAIVVMLFSQSIYAGDDFERREVPSKALTVWGQEQFFKYEIDLIKGKELKVEGVVLVRGKNIFSSWITRRTKSQASHAALWLSDPSGNHYIYESTGSPEQMMSGIRPQVQIGLFDDILDHYPGKVWLRKININEDYAVSPLTVQALVARYLSIPYTKDPRDLTNAAWHSATAEKTDYIFCSQLVALILKDKDVGFLDPHIPSGNYLPKHFFEDPLEPGQLRLTNATWGEQILIKDKKGRRLDQISED